MADKKYKLITRSDFDGLVCAILLTEIGLISDIRFVHPKDMQDEKVPVSKDDISTNLPYVDGVYLAFDHHASEVFSTHKDNYIIDPQAPSTARVVYNYYGGKKKFPTLFEELLAAVDKADGGYFTQEDILYPKKWELLNFILDPRTGLGRFREFKKNHIEVMELLIDYGRSHTIDEIMELPDIKERIELYHKYEDEFKEQINRCSATHKNLIVLDLKNEKVIYPGNRFMIYSIYPTSNISIHVMWGKDKKNTVFAVGKSIFKRTSKTNIGQLMKKYGGGGHARAGTCQVSNDRAVTVLEDLIDQITTEG